MARFYDDDYMIAWTPNYGGREAKVKVGRWPDETGWSNAYSCTSGCCYTLFLKWGERKQAQALLNLAAELMFVGVKPQDVLEEFSKIEIWENMGVLMPQGLYKKAFLPGQTRWNPYVP